MQHASDDGEPENEIDTPPLEPPPSLPSTLSRSRTKPSHVAIALLHLAVDLAL